MIRNRNDIWVAGVFVLALVGGSAACGQHIDILLWNDGGKVGVGEYDYDNLTANDRRVQIARFDDGYAIDSPGFTAFEGADALPADTNVEWNYLPMTVDTGPSTGYRSTVLYWNGTTAEPEFGPTATDEYEFVISPLVSLPVPATGAAEVETGGVVVRTDASGAVHDHPYYFLDDNGDGLNDTLPDAGIYVVALELLVADLEPSDPVFMVWATPELEVLPAIRPAALWVNDRLDTLFVAPVEGDYNADGKVDAADYTVWRDSLGQAGESLPADGNGDEIVDSLDFEVWRGNCTAAAVLPNAMFSLTVPEPHSARLLFALSIGGGVVLRRRVSLGA